MLIHSSSFPPDNSVRASQGLGACVLAFITQPVGTELKFKPVIQPRLHALKHYCAGEHMGKKMCVKDQPFLLLSHQVEKWCVSRSPATLPRWAASKGHCWGHWGQAWTLLPTWPTFSCLSVLMCQWMRWHLLSSKRWKWKLIPWDRLYHRAVCIKTTKSQGQHCLRRLFLMRENLIIRKDFWHFSLLDGYC